MAIYQGCYFGAVSFSSITAAAFISICSSPLFIAILAVQYLKEKLTIKVYLALGLGTVGTALFVANPQTSATQNATFFFGTGLALAAGLSYAIHVIIAKASVINCEPIQLVTFDFMVAAFLLTPTLFFEPTLTHSVEIGWPFLLYLGLIPTGLAYTFYFVGLRHTSATVAGIAVLLEPLTATLLGTLFFNEPMGLINKFGALLVLVAIILLTIKQEAL
jgi:DME family drug/metabolite transporter